MDTPDVFRVIAHIAHCSYFLTFWCSFYCQDVFVILDPKVLRLKNKERQRHLFLFEQALLVTKEMKDSDGKVVYFYKYKLKVCKVDNAVVCISRS